MVSAGAEVCKGVHCEVQRVCSGIAQDIDSYSGQLSFSKITQVNTKYPDKTKKSLYYKISYYAPEGLRILYTTTTHTQKDKHTKTEP